MISGPKVVAIIGQGIAGTCLGLELERAGIDFVIYTGSAEESASRVAAGLINPVTGQRFVKSWRIDELLPVAREAYARYEQVLGVKLWHEVDIRRAFANEAEAERGRRKFLGGELGEHVGACDESGLTVRGGAWVDLVGLMEAARRRWARDGRLVSGSAVLQPAKDAPIAAAAASRVEAPRSVLCVGSSQLVRTYFPRVRVVPVKGQIISIEAEGGACDVRTVMHAGFWLRADSPTRARVGATYESGKSDRDCTDDAREQLMDAARRLVPRGVNIKCVDHDAAVRLVADDKLPVVGWSDVDPNVGILGALGSKGALWAPWLAQNWSQHLCNGSSLNSVVSSQRWVSRDSAAH